MEINQEVLEILKEFRIGKDAGILCLLGIYHGLDVDTVVPEEVVKSINLTKIVERDYSTKTITWNVPLFIGQETAFNWVMDWMDGFSRINTERRGSVRDAVPRMKAFFAKYPEYRKEDVIKATELYFASIKDPKYLMKSHKFIFDGVGAMKKSTLLEYCEKVATSNSIPTNLKGRVIT